MRKAFDTVIGLRHGLLRARRLVVIALADGVHNVFWLWHEVRERFEKVLEARSGIVPSHTPLLSRPSPGAGAHSTVPDRLSRFATVPTHFFAAHRPSEGGRPYMRFCV